jgi:MoaA/NifB/PqqE/SkfB family radical SAM enzyme
MISYKRLAHLLARYGASQIKRISYVLNIEVTNRCNAKCEHCICWQIEAAEESSDYVDIVRKFRPCVIWLTGGEPLLRDDIISLIKRIRETDPHLYLGMATNGWLLSSELGRQLADAGLDQVNISLDFIGNQHDDFRKIKGLYQHIETIVPELKNIGLFVVLTCCIMNQNIDSLLPIARLAETWDIEVGYSCYSQLKTGKKNNSVATNQIEQVRYIIKELCVWKKERGFIKSLFSYLRKIPEFCEKGTLGTCKATKTWLYITPDGYLKICPDKPIYAHYTDYSGSAGIVCGDCWYTCRGEMETPVMERFICEVKNSRRKKSLKMATPYP